MSYKFRDHIKNNRFVTTHVYEENKFIYMRPGRSASTVIVKTINQKNTEVSLPYFRKSGTNEWLENITDDEIRPKVECKISGKDMHSPFLGFNRAQFSVIEASVLVSRLGIISIDKIEKEFEYLKIGFEKTSGTKEKEAWKWIQNKIKNFKKKL